LRKRYALVGAGSRATMFLDAIAGPYASTSQLVGLCDPSQTRMQWHQRRLSKRFDAPAVPMFCPRTFDQMIEQTKPDVVIVTSIDSTHHKYIIRAMELGCDVLCEKPMTTTGPCVRDIFHAIECTGQQLRVAFNYRYAPHTTKVRELIMSGAIGTPMAVDMQWMLDTSHGADYFRRWHAEKHFSGGLLVHKATHHFDIINWWLDSYPQTVFAMGDLKFYGQRAAQQRGHVADYTCSREAPPDDPFRLKWEDHQDQAELYIGPAEDESGYIRDLNVFGEHVTIEDTMAVMAKYRSGVILSYSLIAYSPWEGFRVSVTGTKGRVELYSKHSSHIFSTTIDEDARKLAEQEENRITLFPMFGVPTDVPIPSASGAHGGGDAVLMEQLFSETPPPDPFGRAASHIDGAASCLLGIAANESMASHKPVEVDSLFRLPRQAVNEVAMGWMAKM